MLYNVCIFRWFLSLLLLLEWIASYFCNFKIPLTILKGHVNKAYYYVKCNSFKIGPDFVGASQRSSCNQCNLHRIDSAFKLINYDFIMHWLPTSSGLLSCDCRSLPILSLVSPGKISAFPIFTLKSLILLRTLDNGVKMTPKYRPISVDLFFGHL